METPRDQRLEVTTCPSLRKKPRVDPAAINMVAKVITTGPAWRRQMLKYGTEPNASPIAWFQFQHSWEYYLALKEAGCEVQQVPETVLGMRPQLDKIQWDHFIAKYEFNSKTWKLFARLNQEC